MNQSKYDFNVLAISKIGLIEKKSTCFRLQVFAALWQRLYFLLFMLIMFAALMIIRIYFFLARIAQNIKEQMEDEHRFPEFQFRKLRNQLAPHFIFSGLNEIGSSIYQAQKSNTGSTGKGTEIIKEFISMFNRFNEKKIHFEIKDVLNDSGIVSGTRVIVKLPIDYTYKQLNPTL